MHFSMHFLPFTGSYEMYGINYKLMIHVQLIKSNKARFSDCPQCMTHRPYMQWYTVNASTAAKTMSCGDEQTSCATKRNSYVWLGNSSLTAHSHFCTHFQALKCIVHSFAVSLYCTSKDQKTFFQCFTRTCMLNRYVLILCVCNIVPLKIRVNTLQCA